MRSLLPGSARRLRAALGPDRRPNPDEAPSWPLERRHAEGGEWFAMGDFASEEAALDEVAGPLVPPDYGDLVRLLDPRGRTQGFWVTGRRGLLDAGRVPRELGFHGWDWEEAWEAAGASASAMMQAAQYADRRRIVLAACDAADLLLARLPTGATVLRDPADAARAWAEGTATKREVLDAMERARRARQADRDLQGMPYYGPSRAALCAGGAATEMGVA